MKRLLLIGISFFLVLPAVLFCKAAGDFELKLPFQNKEKFILTAGYNTVTIVIKGIQYGHIGKDLYALDFTQNGCEAHGKPAVAIASGTIELTLSEKQSGGYGNMVKIRHSDGKESVYAHLDSISKKTGTVVAQGETLGLIGNTGNYVGIACKEYPGTHLHFVMREEQKQENGAVKIIPYKPEPMSGYGDNQERGNFIVGQWYESDNAIAVEKAENLPIEQKNNESWWQKIIDFVSKIFKTPENVNVVQNSMIPLSENKKNEAAITQTNDSSDVEKSEEASVLKEISFNSYDSSCDGIFTGYLQYSQNGWEYQSKEVLKSNDQETVNGLFKSKTENCQIEIMAGPPLGGSFCGFGEDRKKDCQEDKITINGNEINRNYGAYVSGSEEFGAQYYLGVDDKRCCYQNDCGYTFMFFIDAPDSSIGQKCMKDFEEMLKTFQIKNDAIGKKETVSNNENNQPIASGIKEIGSYAEVKASYGRYIVIDKYVYMLKGNAVDVVDVSDVNNPKIISSYNYYNDTRDIDYDGKYLYIAGGTYGMAIVDISDPYHLKEIGRGVSSDLGIRQYAIGIEIDGDKAYMCGHTMTGLALADVSDPNSPKRIASYNIACGHHDFFVRGDYAYSISGNNIEVLDLANPDPPNILSKSLNLHSIGRYTVKGEISNFVIVGVKAYASYGNGFEIIDISNPKVIKKIAEYNIKHYRLFISQDQKRLYAACGTDGLKVIDVSNIDNIREIAAWEQGGVSVNNVVVSDGRAYVQSNKIEDAPIYGSDFRLRIFDISKI